MGTNSVLLRGKVALVTGAAGKNGIGRAIAVRLAEEGAPEDALAESFFNRGAVP